jgi:hypothetical protein
MQGLTCYKEPMPKPIISEEDKKNEVLGVSVSSKTKDNIADLGIEYERSLSYIAGALLLRGLAAYHRDGRLKEPPDDQDGTIVDDIGLTLNDPVTEKRLQREATKRKHAAHVQKPQKRAGGKH